MAVAVEDKKEQTHIGKSNLENSRSIVGCMVVIAVTMDSNTNSKPLAIIHTSINPIVIGPFSNALKSIVA